MIWVFENENNIIFKEMDLQIPKTYLKRMKTLYSHLFQSNPTKTYTSTIIVTILSQED